ncbi:MAG TPA: response regulator, partial [Candidatus Aminicenantes bacterium]|nr:response regulator [Candidatus Aminicenantes bacterium]
TILVAEDDPAVRKMTVSVIEEAGYAVLSARNGEEALEILNRNADAISLVLLDVVMPGKNGHEVWEEIRKRCPGLPVLFSSGYSKNAIHTNFILHEGLKLIQKPYGPEKLLKSIRLMLDEEKRG